MKVQYIDNITKRSDNKKGKPKNITLFKHYTVVEELETQFTILNDEGKICRYSKSRFLISNNETVPEIREAFNTLTNPMRTELKKLRKLIKEHNL